MALPKAGVELVAEGLASFTADMAKGDKAVSGFGDASKEAAKAMDLFQDATGRWRTASGRFASDAEKAAAGVESIAPAANRAGDAAKKAGDDAEQGGRGFSAFGEIVTGALRKIGELGVEALLKAGQAVTSFVGDSIGLAGDFQAGMLEFQAVAGKGVDAKGLEEFHDLFLDLGKELPVSTSDVQKAAIEMVKGGIDPAIVAAGGLRQNIRFAAAAMDGDLVKAAEVSAKILGGWTSANATAAEKADFLTHSTDLLTKAANASSVDVNELSLGIFNAQGIAKTAGVPFDDLTTTLALLAPRFASSSEAGNSLKNMIARLQPTTDPATKAMAALGLWTEETGSAFYDAQGNFVGFEKASALLQGSLKGLTKEQQTALLQQIFGNDAMGAAAALAEGGAEAYGHMAESLAKANGVQENAALKQQGFNTALDNAKGSVETLMITVGEKLLPVLTDLLNNVVAPGINLLTDMAAAVFGDAEAFNKLPEAAQGVVEFIGGLVDGVGGVIDAFNDAGAMSSEFGESIGYLADQLGLPGELIQDIVFAVQDFVKWVSDLLDILFPAEEQLSDASKALAALSGETEETTKAISPLQKAIEDLSGIWEKAIDVVGNVMDGYQDIIDSVLPQVQRFIDEHGDEISAFFKESWDKIIEIVNLALDLYNAIVPPILHAIADFIDDHGSEIQRILEAAWDAVSTLIGGALDLIKETIQLAIDVIHGDWDAAWKDIQKITETLTGTLKGTIEGFLNIIAGFFDTNLAEIGELWKNNFDQMIEIAMKIGDRMVAAGESIIDGIIEGLKNNAGGVIDFLIDLAKDAFDAFMRAIAGGSPAMEFVPAGASMVQGIMLGLSEMWPAMTALVASMGEDLIKQAADLGRDVQGAIADAFGATASIDRQIAKNLDAVTKIEDDFYRQHAVGALKQVEQQARAFLDPTEGAKFFKMRSEQILEYAKLQKQLAEAETSADRARIKQQMLLINAAQTAEINAFNADLGAGLSATERLTADIQAFLASKGTTTDAQGKPIEVALPGILENSTIAAITGWLNQLTNYDPYAYIRPPASPAQQASTSTSGPVYNQQRTYSMPIYTNQSPAVIQDSMAIAQATMP